jgi:DNA-binding PadR family transcriptional regulator
MVNIYDQDVAVLGLLYEHHHYPHRLCEIMEKRGMGNWTDIDFSSVNSILEKLELKNLVESRKRDKKGKSSGKIYYITREGKLVLKEKIKDILEGKGKVVYPFDLGIANICVLSHDELIQSLDLYLNSIETRIQSLEYTMKIQKENNIPYNFIAIYSRSIQLLKAEKEWLKDFIITNETSS